MLTLLSVVFGTAWGGSITFADLGLENSVQYSDPFDGGDFTVTFSGGANDGKYYTTGQGIRVYGNGTMTVAAKSGSHLTKVAITFAGDTYRPESADVVDTGSYDPESGVWTGSASSVAFTRPTGSGHWRIQVVEATVEGGSTVEKTTPTLSFEPTSLTITKGEAFTEPVLSYDGDGKVTYSIDKESVATINASTGKLTIVGIGTANITATAEETANYKRGTASYSLKVEAGETPDEGDAIVFAELGLENAVQYPDPFDGGTFTVTFAGGANDGKYYNTGQGIRVYGNGTMTVAAKSGNLTKVIVTFNNSNRPESADVVDTGTFDPGTGVWVGQSPTVTFTRPAGTGHWRVQKVAAVIDGEAPAPRLTISGTTPFKGSTKVTITPSNPDYAVYYTTDGSNPTTNPTTYTGPFTITETTTVKAVEEDWAGEMSAVVEKTFVKEETPDVTTVADIAAFKALEDGKEATLTLTNAQVLYAGTNDIYVRDASGAIDFYNTGLSLSTGQVLNGSVTGKRATYNSIPELAKSDNTSMAGISATSGTAVAKTVTVAQAKAEAYFCDLIRIEGVKVVSKQEGSYTNIYAYVGNDSIWIYDRFKVGLGDWNENDTYNVEGILVPYKGFYEVYLTQPLTGGTTPPDPVVTVCDNIAAFKALASGTEAELKLNNAQVLYANGRDVYVRDASGAIEFYNLGIDFATNQVLNGSIIGKYSPFQGLPEIAKTDKTNAEKFTASEGAAAQPLTIGIAAAQEEKYLCELLKFSNVTISADAISDGSATLTLFNKFGLDLPSEATTGDVTGILVMYKEAYQLYPISIGGGQTPPDPQITVCDNIAAFKALESGTEAELKLNNAQVVYANGRDVYVRDASGAIEFYNLGIEYATNQVLNGSIIGKYSPFQGLPEIVKTDNTNAEKYTVSAGAEAQPVAIGVAAAQEEKYLCDLLKFSGVTISADAISDGSATLTLFNKFKIDLPEDGATGDVTGILVMYKDAYQLYPISISTGDTPQPSLPVCDNIAAFKALESGTEAELKLNNAQVVYANGRDVFVRDASGAIEFYNLGIEYATNQVLNGSIIGKYSPFQGLPEIAKTDKTSAEKYTVSEGAEAQPVSLTVAASQDAKYLCDLLKFSGVTINADAISDASGSLAIFNKFKIEVPEAGATGDVIGILVMYKEAYQLYPISIDTSNGINMTTVETATNAPAYNLAGQRVGDNFKGVVIVNGKKIVRK